MRSVVGALLALRLTGAGLTAAMAGIHAYLWGEGYGNLETIGELFLVNAIVGGLLAVALLVTGVRLLTCLLVHRGRREHGDEVLGGGAHRVQSVDEVLGVRPAVRGRRDPARQQVRHVLVPVQHPDTGSRLPGGPGRRPGDLRTGGVGLGRRAPPAYVGGPASARRAGFEGPPRTGLIRLFGRSAGDQPDSQRWTSVSA